MRILALDVETNSLQPGPMSIIEIGLVLYETDSHSCLEVVSWLVGGTISSPETQRLTGISQAVIDEFGRPYQFVTSDFFKVMDKAEAIMGHNALGFDVPHIDAAFGEYRKLSQVIKDRGLPVIDTRYDLPYPPEIKTRNLRDIAAAHQVNNLFAHRAIFDVFAMLQIFERYDLQEVIANSKEPLVTMKALSVPPGYGFHKEGSFWVRQERASLVGEVVEALPFKIHEIERR